MYFGLLLALLVLGLLTGFAAGLFGIGGGMILVPMLTLIFSLNHVPATFVVHMSIATSLGIILFTSISSVYAHHKRGAVRWPIAFMLIPGVIIGSWIGPMIAAHLDTRYLAALFGLFVVFSALRMLSAKKKVSPQEAPRHFGTVQMSSAGLVIGTISGLVGAGGGFITVPFLNWRGVAIHNAVATSAVMGFPIATFGALSYIHQGAGIPGLPEYSLGYVYLPALLCIAATSVLSAPWGARTAHRMNVTQLRRSFAHLLLLLAIYMFWKALAS